MSGEDRIQCGVRGAFTELGNDDLRSLCQLQGGGKLNSSAEKAQRRPRQLVAPLHKSGSSRGFVRWLTRLSLHPCNHYYVVERGMSTGQTSSQYSVLDSMGVDGI